MGEFDDRELQGSDEGSEKKGLTRRGFLGAAAVAGAAAGVGTSLLGSSPAMAAGYSTAMPKTWNKTYDVVVIGTGCGLGAAIEASKAKASVCVVDRADHVGGLYITAGGSFTMGGNNVVQKAAGITDNDDTWFADEMFTNDWRAQPEVVRTLVNIGADTVKWFQDLGIIYAPISAGVLRGPIQRGITALPYDAAAPLPAGSVPLPAGVTPVKYPGGSGYPNTGIAFTWVMYQEVVRRKIPIMLNTTFNKIYRDADGVVRGIRCVKAGKTINIRAKKGVVIAAGTWTDNQAMMQQWDPRLVGPDCYGDGGTPTDGTLYVNSAGDGIRFAQKVGAAVADMSFACYLYIFFGGRSYWGWGHDPIDWTKNTSDGTIKGTATYAAGKAVAQSAATFQSTILVANNGKRYVNESTRMNAVPSGKGAYSENPEMPFTDAYLNLPQPRNVWMVADSVTAAALSWPITANGSTAVSTIDKPDPKTGAMFDPACIAIDTTIAGLAAKMGVDATNLAAEITKYNGFVAAGVDTDFGKPTPKGKIATAPFYALKASLIRHTQRNGLRCNTKMQVIEEMPRYAPTTSIDKLKTIPHLYVAGESGDILGWRRGHNTLAHYVSAARIAGMNAAKEKSV
jgi:succinate dehydrogenase/fumarate reductase flavoprotein subunit